MVIRKLPKLVYAVTGNKGDTVSFFSQIPHVLENVGKKIFQAFGAVQYCNLVLDLESGKSKGFAFIEMPKSGEAKAAMKNLNNKTIGILFGLFTFFVKKIV